MKNHLIPSSDNSLQKERNAELILQFSPHALHTPEAPEAHLNPNCKYLTELDITRSPQPNVDEEDAVSDRHDRGNSR